VSKADECQIGWNPFNSSRNTYLKTKDFWVFKLPNKVNQIKILGQHRAKNGQCYWRVYINGESTHIKSLDKAKELVLNELRNEAMKIVNFVDGLKNE